MKTLLEAVAIVALICGLICGLMVGRSLSHYIDARTAFLNAHTQTCAIDWNQCP